MKTNATPFTDITAITLRIVELKARLESVKPLYAELDSLILECVRCGIRTLPFDSGNGIVTTYEIIDNFENTNTVFRPAGVKRYELKNASKAKRKGDDV